MAETYGFGGSEPTTGMNPGESAESVNTNAGQTVEGVDSTIRDAMHTDNIAGQSPVSGLGMMPTWDAAFQGSNISYVENKVPVSSDGKTATIGRWPIQYDPFDGQPVTHRLPDPTPMVGEG